MHCILYPHIEEGREGGRGPPHLTISHAGLPQPGMYVESGDSILYTVFYTADIYIYPSKLDYFLLRLQCSIVQCGDTDLYTFSPQSLLLLSRG